MSDEQLECALDLARRLPPSQIEEHLSGIIELVPDLTEDLLSAIDQPLKVARDKSKKKDYLLCDYNRDGDSYRSPWSNKYDPPLSDGTVPSDRVRGLEVKANEMFEVYLSLYYEGGTSSVYMWDLDDGFAACVVLKKSGSTAKHGPVKGSWDSIHVIEVHEKGRTASYQLTTTVMLNLATQSKDTGDVSLAGSLTRQTVSEEAVAGDDSHVANLGRVVEAMENRMRDQLEVVYFGKTRDIIAAVREPMGKAERANRDKTQGKVATGLDQWNMSHEPYKRK